MKRLVVVLALAAGLVALAVPAVASASVPIGPCQLRAFVPQPAGNGAWNGNGKIDTCSIRVDGLNLNVCVQVRTPSGGAATISGTCRNPGWEGCCSLSVWSGQWWPVGGHVYRTWDAGVVYSGGWYQNTTYQSSWFQYLNGPQSSSWVPAPPVGSSP